MNDIPLLVMSCDKYQTAWHPFFELLKKYWKHIPNRIYLCTESLDYTHEGLDIQMLHLSGAWATRFIHALDEVDSEYIYFALEDFFLSAPVNEEAADRCAEYMKTHPDVANICFETSYFCAQINYLSYPVEELPGFYELKDYNFWKIHAQFSLWKTATLRKYLREGESPWDFEDKGTDRVATETDKFIRYYNPDYPKNIRTSVFPYQYLPRFGYGIVQGKWLWNNKKLFAQNGFEVDLSHEPKMSHATYILKETAKSIGRFAEDTARRIACTLFYSPSRKKEVRANMKYRRVLWKPIRSWKP